MLHELGSNTLFNLAITHEEPNLAKKIGLISGIGLSLI